MTVMRIPQPSPQMTLWLILLSLVGGLLVAWSLKHPKASRLIVALLAAVLLSGGIAYADPCCGFCDPWWLTYFWICVPQP